MYSMVLMMAMSASPEATAFGGCNGYSCSGYSCQGNTCHGGGLFKGRSCHGCSGYSCTGCSGYTAGCSGYTSCCGCKGGGIFGGMFRGHGCKGSCQGYTSCCGCTGYTSCAGCVGTPGGCIGTPVAPKTTEPIPAPKKGGVTAAPAMIVVNVPADATVTIDGTPTKSTTAVRVFATPELAPGSVYYYNVTAQVVRDGKTLTATEKIAVEAGANSVLSLNPTTAAVVASK